MPTRPAVLACALLLVAAGCSTSECKPYAVGSGVPAFVGTYACQQTAAAETCTGWQLCEGPTTLQITSVGTKLLIVKTDCMGYYYEYEGTVCEPDTTTQGYFSFYGRRNLTEPQDDPVAFYNLNGQITVGAAKNTARGTISLTISPRGGKACVMMGQLTCECVDCT